MTTSLQVHALAALVYCERLFFLEEVEGLRVADAAIFDGRRVHLEEAARLEEAEGVWTEQYVASETLGLRGRVDILRRRNGEVIPCEIKRGRARRELKAAVAWDDDEVQIGAYALLLEEHLGCAVPLGRVRYLKDGVSVPVAIDGSLRARVLAAVERGRQLARSADRPPVTKNESKCVRCSLAPVCLPEEARLADAVSHDAERPSPVRLFPPDTERRSLHVVTQGARVGRSGGELSVAEPGDKPVTFGVREVSDVVLHGHAQITTQALRLCADEGVPVHLVTTSGAYLGGFASPSGGVQRRLRQYRGLSDETLSFALARRIVQAKVENQLRHVLRASRGDDALRESVDVLLEDMRKSLRLSGDAADRTALMGYEGAAARAYFAALARLVLPAAGDEMVPRGRSRQPPADRFNALLSFLYGLLYRDVLSAIWRVGLEPAFGLLHQPRSSAYPLVLDLMELFRVPIADLAVLGAVNRRTFDPQSDFRVTGRQVWLSDDGRKKAIAIYERRKHEEYRHEAVGYSLSYARMLELETRLLEKEWSGEPGLFARLRLR